jgi:hypothetical protein
MLACCGVTVRMLACNGMFYKLHTGGNILTGSLKGGCAKAI